MKLSLNKQNIIDTIEFIRGVTTEIINEHNSKFAARLTKCFIEYSLNNNIVSSGFFKRVTTFSLFDRTLYRVLVDFYNKNANANTNDKINVPVLDIDVALKLLRLLNSKENLKSVSGLRGIYASSVYSKILNDINNLPGWSKINADSYILDLEKSTYVPSDEFASYMDLVIASSEHIDDNQLCEFDSLNKFDAYFLESYFIAHKKSDEELESDEE